MSLSIEDTDVADFIPQSATNEPTTYKVGQLVTLTKGREGIIRYIGQVHFTDGILYGIELSDGSRGKHDGTVYDVTYFSGRKGACIFVNEDAIVQIGGIPPAERAKRSRPPARSRAMSTPTRRHSERIVSSTKKPAPSKRLSHHNLSLHTPRKKSPRQSSKSPARRSSSGSCLLSSKRMTDSPRFETPDSYLPTDEDYTDEQFEMLSAKCHAPARRRAQSVRILPSARTRKRASSSASALTKPSRRASGSTTVLGYHAKSNWESDPSILPDKPMHPLSRHKDSRKTDTSKRSTPDNSPNDDEASTTSDQSYVDLLSQSMPVLLENPIDEESEGDEEDILDPNANKLKKFMFEKDVWVEELYEELISMQVDDPSYLDVLSRREVDKMVSDAKSKMDGKEPYYLAKAEKRLARFRMVHEETLES